MTQRAVVIFVTVLGTLLFKGSANGQDLTDVNEVVRRANLSAYYAGDDGRARVRMTIIDSQGRERVRQFTILRRDESEGGDQDYVVLFSRPADVRNTVFLVKKHLGKADDRWLYLPGLDLLRRIAAGDKRTSFIGSHFFYEDVSGRGVEEDTHELVETTNEFYIVKNIPIDEGSMEFSSWTAWIDKNTFLPKKMEYIDNTGNVYRRIEALQIEDIGGYHTVTKMKVSDLRSGGHTISEFRNVQYDLKIPKSVFTERTLRNPSRQWFRVK